MLENMILVPILGMDYKDLGGADGCGCGSNNGCGSGGACSCGSANGGGDGACGANDPPKV